MRNHLVTGTAIAIAAALFSALLVVWDPTITGKVVVGAAVGAWLGIWLGKHRHAKRGLEAMLAGGVLSLALLIWLPAAIPFVVFLACIGPSAAHYLNPRRARVVRTTRGVRTTGAKAAGGRTGRPNEQVARPRRAASSSSVGTQPARAAIPPELLAILASALAQTQAPAQPRKAWPHANPGFRPVDLLPWAGEGAEPSVPRKLRHDTGRPSTLHRQICTLCLDGDCGLCKDRGCECPNSHPLRAPAPRPASADLDTPPY